MDKKLTKQDECVLQGALWQEAARTGSALVKGGGQQASEKCLRGPQPRAETAWPELATSTIRTPQNTKIYWTPRAKFNF